MHRGVRKTTTAAERRPPAMASRAKRRRTTKATSGSGNRRVIEEMPSSTSRRLIGSSPGDQMSAKPALPVARAGRTSQRAWAIYELPDMRLVKTEHRVESICSPTCPYQTRACFPAAAHAPGKMDQEGKRWRCPCRCFSSSLRSVWGNCMRTCGPARSPKARGSTGLVRRPNPEN